MRVNIISHSDVSLVFRYSILVMHLSFSCVVVNFQSVIGSVSNILQPANQNAWKQLSNDSTVITCYYIVSNQFTEFDALILKMPFSLIYEVLT